MTINGNFKFFELSKALFSNGDSVAVSTGSSSANNLIDFDPTTRWESVGSDDSTTETLTFTFANSVAISRILLLNHNFRDYTIAPIVDAEILDGDGLDILDDASAAITDGGAVLPFQRVISITSSVESVAISETDYTNGSSYYEFDPIICSGLLITITKAQTLNDVIDLEKFCFRVIPTLEVNSNTGTFTGYPILQRPRDFFGSRSRSINGRFQIKKLTPVFTAAISFSPAVEQTDGELVEHLRERGDDFLIWPNGGNLTITESTTDNFYRFDLAPYRLKDIYKVQVDNHFMPTYTKNIFTNPFNTSLSIREVD